MIVKFHKKSFRFSGRLRLKPAQIKICSKQLLKQGAMQVFLMLPLPDVNRRGRKIFDMVAAEPGKRKKTIETTFHGLSSRHFDRYWHIAKLHVGMVHKSYYGCQQPIYATCTHFCSRPHYIVLQQVLQTTPMGNERPTISGTGH